MVASSSCLQIVSTIQYDILIYFEEIMKTLGIDTPNSGGRRGSVMSTSNEIQANNIARTLHNIRKGGSASTFDSSDSESDVEEPTKRRKMDRRKSCVSMLRKVLARVFISLYGTLLKQIKCLFTETSIAVWSIRP